MRIESKSAIKFARSYGEDLKIASNETLQNQKHSPLVRRQRGIRQDLARLLHEFHVQAQRLQLADEHVERFGHARLDGRLALDDGLVDLRAAVHVVGLGRQQFLQDVGGAVSFERPDLHFAETLSAELRLAAQRLLRDQGVRTDGARVDLVVHKVRELQHVDVAHGHRLLERYAGHSVVQHGLAGRGQPRFGQVLLDLALGGAVEHRGGELQPQRLGRPAEVRLQDLPHVHTRGHAQGIEDDFNRRPVGQVRHVLIRQDAGNDALVPVPAGHLIAHRELALHRDVYLHELDHARRQLVALAQLADFFLGNFLQDRDLARRHFLDLVDLLIEPRILVLEAHALQVARFHRFDDFAGDVGIFREQALVGLLVVQVGEQPLARQKVRKALGALVGQNADLVLKVALEPLDLRFLDRLRPLVLLLPLAGEDLAIHDRALDARRAVEGSVLDVARLLAEDGAQQFLFGSELGLALRRDLAHQDVARLHRGADADDAALVQVAQERIRDVGDVAGDFLGSQLGVAGLDLELLNVNRGVVIFLDQLLADQDGVLKVVPAPRHERHQHVPAERQFTIVRAGTVGQHLAFHDFLALLHDGLLVDAGVLVGAGAQCGLRDGSYLPPDEFATPEQQQGGNP